MEEPIASIKYWAEDDRPREKFLLKGREALSDAELIAILIASGTRELSALALARQVLALCGNSLSDLGRCSITELTKVRGIGEAKALAIAAALELGRRRKDDAVHERQRVITSKDAFHYFNPVMGDQPHEEFWVLLLNRSNKILSSKKISSGGISGTVADVKLIFKYAVEGLATSIILCHNHPSGNVKPSEADVALTKKLASAGQLLDIQTVDHIIIGDNTYFSFADEGMM